MVSEIISYIVEKKRKGEREFFFVTFVTFPSKKEKTYNIKFLHLINETSTKNEQKIHEKSK